MKNIFKFNKIGSIIFLSVFMLFGIFIALQFNTELPENSIECKATITNIIDETVFISFDVDGETYSGILDYYTSFMNEGDIVTIYVNEFDPSIYMTKESMSVPLYIGVVFVIIPLIMMIFLIFGKNKKYDVVDYSFNGLANNSNNYINSSDDEISNIKEETNVSNSSSSTYFFHIDKRFPQGYILENSNKEVVYEVKSANVRFLSATTYKFINSESGSTKEHKIGPTISSSSSSGNIRYNTNTYFKYDGENIWDVLKSKGITSSRDLSMLTKPKYTLFLRGEEIATIESTGVDVYGEKQTFLSNLSVPGFYKVSTNYDFLDPIVLFLVAISKCYN